MFCTSQLFYLDRVQFWVTKIEKWFPTAINWSTQMVSTRKKVEKLLREYERGKII